MTFLGPIDRLHFWSINPDYRRLISTGVLRREEEIESAGNGIDVRYTLHEFRGTRDGD